MRDDELQGALANIRRCLRPGGLFVFDVENADGVKRERLDRVFTDYQIDEANVSLVRFNQSQLLGDTVLDWLSVYFLQKGARLTVLHDRIKLRFFYSTELKALLRRGGFRVLGLGGGPGKRFDPTGPSIYVVAQRV